VRTRILLIPAALAASALALAGCAGSGSGSSSSDSGTVQVVASTNVYGSIAKAVGGDRVTVTSMVDSASQDPHEFEASARDQLLVQRADLLIENGGGYDPFLDTLVESSGSKAPLITAAKLSPEYPADGDLDSHKDDADHGHDHLEGFNEHVFYDPAVMSKLATELADRLGKIDPDHASEFEANAKTFATGATKIESTLAGIAKAHENAGVFVTEPLPLYLTDAAALDNKTPGAFSEAVEEGQDVPPATLLSALSTISSGQVAVVITNAQAAGAETTQVEQKAKAANVPVLKFSELVPDGQTYLDWMQGNADALAKALG
jgi:zinc/manganese transport system substrate-binding protein